MQFNLKRDKAGAKRIHPEDEFYEIRPPSGGAEFLKFSTPEESLLPSIRTNTRHPRTPPPPPTRPVGD